jgi:iron complex outermembrane receptor protein
MNISNLLLLALLGASYNFSAQTELPTATVEAYGSNCLKELVPGEIHVLDSAALHGFSSSDLSRALNFIPGVKMETRGDGGSRRLHVRGSSLRSPYSVRNSMIIMDGFVLTEADGNSPLELIDPDLISQLSLVTGPAAASYGGAYGGALQISSISNPSIGEHRWLHKSYGTTGADSLSLHSRLAGGLSYGFEKGHISLSAVSTINPGYRSWEWNNKIQFQLSAKYYDLKGGTHTVFATHYDGAWALPGAIKLSQVDTLPTASPGEGFNAHVARVREVAGYRYSTSLNSGWDISSSILGRTTSKSNPYGSSAFYNGYKEENGNGFSSLSSATKILIDDENGKLGFEATIMHINDQYNIVEWESEPTPLTVIIPMRYDLDFNATQTFASTSCIITNENGLRVEAQIGASYRSRNTTGIIYNDADEELDYLSDTTSVSILPRLGVSYRLSSGVIVFGQFSTGFSDPTAFELVSPEDFQPTHLSSESAIGFEAGVRTQLTEDIRLNCTLYRQTVNNAILQIEQENDAITFENIDGGLVMAGMESTIDWKVCDHFHVSGFGSLALHTFGELTDHEGKQLPGSPKATGGMQFISVNSWGTANLDARYVGETPLNNIGTSYMDAYYVIDASVSVNLPNSIILESGVKNILDAEYSNWPQLNGVYGKFYNPAPPRTFYISLRWAI